MALSRLFPPAYVFLTANGQEPAAAGQVYFYTNNTTNLATVYTDAAGSTPSSNPLTLGSDGRLPNDVFTSATLRVKVTDSLGATIFQDDDVSAFADGATLSALSASSGSSLVGHIASGTGATARTVQSILRDIVTPLNFGAVGDGSTDDTTALTNTINAASGRTIDLLGRTYKIASTLTGVSGMKFRNGTFSFATASDTDVLFECYGSTGTQYTLTAAPSKGDTSVAVASATGLAAGDWCFIRSTDNFSPGDSGKKGEWVKVLSVASLTINLEQRIRHSYTTGYTMYKPTLMTGIQFEDVTFIGSGNTGSKAQYAVRAYLCESPRFTRCVAKKFGYLAYSLETCIGGTVTDCEAHQSNLSTGAAYGVSITGGCDGVSVSGGRYSYHRHGVTVGGTYFTDYGITVQGVNTLACADAGIDVHPNAMRVVIDGNQIDCYSTDTTQTGDGITAQGAGVTITDNQVTGWRRIGILGQALTNAPEADDTWTISGNNLSNPQGVSGADAITFSNEKSGGTVRGLSITGNTANGSSATTGKGISIYNTTDGGPIRTVTVTGNSMYTRSEALAITAANLQLIEDVAVSGNSFGTVSSSVPVVSLTANADVSKYLSCVSVGVNTIRGGNYGILLTNAPARVNRGVNIIQGFATAATSGTFSATDGTDVTT